MYMRHACAVAAVLFAGGTAFAQSSGTTGNAFNPSIGLILQGAFSELSDDYPAIVQPGLLAGGEGAQAAEKGFALDESELFLGANIDNVFYGQATVALHEGEVEMEEAYFRTLTLPAGLSLQAGQFLAGVGYQNARHAHAWDFADQALAYSVLMGGQYKDPGVQLTWVAPTPMFLQLGVESMRGDSFPAAQGDHDGKGVTTVFVRMGGDVGVSHSWQASLGNLHYAAVQRETTTAGAPIDFTGSGDVSIAGLVWKWSPLGNWHARNAVFQAEYLRRDESGQVTHGPAGAGRYDGVQDGWYVQGVYQWKPRWRAGLRYDRVNADNTVRGLLDPVDLLPAMDEPQRFSVMLDYSNSEFSRIRLQLDRARGAQGEGTALIVQYIMSLGAHGAHAF